MDELMGVIEISTGLLLRAGFCDFTIDGTFNAATEEQHANAPQPMWTKNDPDFPNSEFITHWTGGGWDLVLRK